MAKHGVASRKGEVVRVPVTRDNVAATLAQLKHDVGALGLLATMHALEPALQTVGWELAGDLEQCSKVRYPRKD